VQVTGTQDIVQAFAKGELVRPDVDELNFVDLVRAVLGLAGSDEAAVTPGVRAIQREIGAAQHYLLILVDGLGLDTVRALRTNAFLRRHLALDLQAVFLPTTATALTTLATGQWPATHGVPGWWTYLPELDCSTTTLPFVERRSDRPLNEIGVTAEDMFPVPSVWPTVRRKVVSLYPSDIAHTTYTNYSTGGTERIGYAGLDDAIEIARLCVLHAPGPSLTYLYLPQLDSVGHDLGTEHPRFLELAIILDHYFAELANELDGKARIVITADHGMANVPPERVFVIAEDDPLCSRLVAQPAGEPTVPMFHVRPGHEDAFVRNFCARLGEYYHLLTSQEVEELRLLGPEPLSPTMRSRVGPFVGIARRPAKLYVEPTGSAHPENPGIHGGMTPGEMMIPLVLA